jgi:hypothetical protein
LILSFLLIMKLNILSMKLKIQLLLMQRFVEHSYNTSTTCCKNLHGMKTLK